MDIIVDLFSILLLKLKSDITLVCMIVYTTDDDINAAEREWTGKLISRSRRSSSREAAFRTRKVISRSLRTKCGYANGDSHYIQDYMLVCSNRFGYREAVCVDYNSSVINLDTVLTVFFFLINLT